MVPPQQWMLLVMVLVGLEFQQAVSFTAVPPSYRRPVTLFATNREWTLEQDWALQDGIQKYTVGKTTFWTQLWLSSPELCCLENETELKQRYETLREMGNATMPIAGDSPLVLQDWSANEDGTMKGNLNGRTDWFKAQLFGSWNADVGEEDVIGAQVGGFVEAVGERVYELGQTREKGAKKGSFELFLPKVLLPSSSGVTAKLSAMVAAFVLSAAIGFGAGTSMVGDDANMFQASTNIPSSSTIAVKYNGPSVSERRARVEARVLGTTYNYSNEGKIAVQYAHQTWL